LDDSCFGDYFAPLELDCAGDKGLIIGALLVIVGD
jgi:hypothetical protein